MKGIYNGTDGGAYRGSRYLAKAISKENKTGICGSFNEDICFVGSGGILVFPTDVVMEELQFFKEKVAKIASANNLLGWTIGKYLNGHYPRPKDGKQYGENSLCVEIVGADIDTLEKIAMELCSSFNLESALLKDYSNGKVLLVNRE